VRGSVPEHPLKRKIDWYERTRNDILVRMSQSTSLAHYRTALRTPAVRGPVIASALARLPIAMVGLSLLLYVRTETGSFASAGLVSAAALIGVASGAVLQGRLADRLGPSRPLLVASVVLALSTAAAIAAIEAHAPTALLVAIGFTTGLGEPAVGSASRALWPRVLPAGPARQAAYSYEAISMEVFFILGPGLAGVLIAAPWPGTGLVTGVLCMLAGAVWFARTPTVRAWGPGENREVNLLGALASPGMRTVAVAAFGFGVTIGYVEVAVPAAAAAGGSPGVGGLLLSLWSISSVGFGVLYSLRPRPYPMHLRLPALLGAFAALVALLALPATLGWLAAAMLLAGSMITPQSTAHSVALEQVASEGTIAEAFGWIITAVTLGLALGQAVSGQLVEVAGPPIAFLAASASGLAVAGVVWLFRGTVAAGAPKRELASVG
jgi:MFS family permease